MVKPSYQTDSLCIYQKGYQQALIKAVDEEKTT
jgi:hypothetical protein